MRWFGASHRRATPKGQNPSSSVQHRFRNSTYRTSSTFRTHQTPDVRPRRPAPAPQARPAHRQALTGAGTFTKLGPDPSSGCHSQLSLASTPPAWPAMPPGPDKLSAAMFRAVMPDPDKLTQPLSRSLAAMLPDPDRFSAMYQASAADQLGAVHGAFHDLAAAFTIRFTPPIQCRSRWDCNFNGVTPETEGDTSDRRDRGPGPGRGGALRG